MEKHDDIIIIGAGAAGLMAAKTLSSAGDKVIILEAAAKAGGRINTIVSNKFGVPVEAGAEFIHGELPVTIQLLKESNIKYTAINGEMIHVRNGQWNKPDGLEAYWGELMQQMNALEVDTTIEIFLDKYFHEDKYAQLRQGVQRFAEGFDLADISRAAVLPLKKEWTHEDEEQYRIDGGYIMLIAHLLECCLEKNVQVHYNCIARSIEWEQGRATVVCNDDQKFFAGKVIITVSAGVLQSGKMAFTPALPAYIDAVNAIGFGNVIKILLLFSEPFWQQENKNAGFILSDEAIPTWWTQSPADTNLLTGWLGGPKTYDYTNFPDEKIIETSLASLSSIFDIAIADLNTLLLHAEVFNWINNEHTLGGYSYNTLSADHAKQLLNTPVDDTIFFAGEAVYNGDSPGTTEAALQSGKDVADKILKR